MTAPVRLELLRAGLADDTLFLVPGVEGVLDELAPMVSAFSGPQEVYAVTPVLDEAVGMDQMAVVVIAAIRRVQPAGPYRLGGYSFGALLALEMAQQLRASGETVESLFLIEAVYDERYWPRGLWLRALVRRTGWQLGRIVRMRPARALGELRHRGVRLVQRLVRRKAGAADTLASESSGMAAHFYAAIGSYRPRHYDGVMTLIASSVDRHFGCDTVRLWTGYADRLVVQRVDGDHLTVMHEPKSAAAVAGLIDHRLALAREGWIGVRPRPGFERPMILTTMRWFAVARLAHTMIEAGFAVSACRPRRHVLELVEGLTGDYRLNRLWRSRSLVAAIKRAQPDIILPDDERALALLRRVHKSADPQMADLIARSLGRRDAWPAITSRTGLASEAYTMNVAAPDTGVIADVDALKAWVDEHGLPMVLKTDGSWGGRGVAVIRDRAQLREAWRTMSSPPSLPRAVKRMLVNLETGSFAAWLRRSRPVVNAQEFVEGCEAIATVACVEGTVQALVCLEVIQASEPKGPAAVVRIIDHPAMAEAAQRLVSRFGLTGFCGFDFILTDTGEAQLLELNPRVTPTCHLLVDGDVERHRTITLFPGADDGFLDLPVRAPSLLRRGELLAARQHGTVARTVRRFKPKVGASRY
jgi:thioesterase domain-containing protein